MSDREDQVLVSQTLAGDRNAFGGLVDRYQKPVFNLALRMVQDRDDAEDIAQSTFVKAYSRLSSFNGSFRFFSWLYKIALNECANCLNRRKRHEPLSEALTSDEGEAAAGLASDEQRHLQEALADLQEGDRVLVLLKHYEGRSYEDIGEILDISEQKVKSRLFSARLKLRAILLRKGVRADG
jgi:RNA polymerase sigma-70 factor (ECF subfamily)